MLFKNIFYYDLLDDRDLLEELLDDLLEDPLDECDFFLKKNK